MNNLNNISNINAIAMRPWCPVVPVADMDCIAIGGYDYIRPGTVGFVVYNNIGDMR